MKSKNIIGTTKWDGYSIRHAWNITKQSSGMLGNAEKKQIFQVSGRFNQRNITSGRIIRLKVDNFGVRKWEAN